jgi:hypothetical protein
MNTLAVNGSIHQVQGSVRNSTVVAPCPPGRK